MHGRLSKYAGALILCLFIVLNTCAAGELLNVEEGVARVHYNRNDEKLARETLSITRESLLEFGKHLEIGDAPINITICSNQSQFRSLAGEYGMARVGGIAKSPQGVIIIKAPYLSPDGVDYRGTLRHELIHVLIARNTEGDNAPRWLDEGLAMVISKELRWESGLRIARMHAIRGLIPYRELNFAFASIGDEVSFGDAYAQALSMTRYLEKRLGEKKFWELILSMKTISFEEALQKFAGLKPSQFYDEWRGGLWKVTLITSLVSGFSLFQIMALLAIIAYYCKRRAGQKLVRQWEEEEMDEPPFHWDDVEEGPYPWEEEYQEEEEEDREPPWRS
jgi:hypothetical protein